MRIYINGTQEATTATTGPIATDTRPLTIGAGDGALYGGGMQNQLQGLVDEVQVYNRALTEQEVQGGGGRSLVTYAYDSLSRRSSVTLPNGTQTTYGYDPASQVTQVLHQLGAAGPTINQAGYNYNAVGNRTSLTDRRGVQAFGYDPLDRLTSTTHPLTLDQSFTYDAVGNRTSGGGLFNAGNQQTEDNTYLYEYDANGNQTKKTHKASGEFTVYTYDPENRLTKVEVFASGGSTPVATSGYRYDGLGRRIEKIGNGQTRRYVYDGEDILLEYDGSNVLQARYTHGPGIDEPVAMVRGGSTYFYHQDGLGSVTELTDGAGAIAKAYAYDAYGNVIEQTGTVENPYAYTGRELDVDTGLYYYRARYYDPRIGRFLQKDPIGLVGGLNLYGFVEQDPVNYTDPFGLKTFACMKPLDALGGRGTRSGPDSWGNPLYHKYICVRDKKGVVTCGGQDRSAGPWSPGKPSVDRFDRNRCQEVEPDNECVERCLLAKFGGSRPFYGLFGLGTNCQEWANDIFQTCQKDCQRRSVTPAQ